MGALKRLLVILTISIAAMAAAAGMAALLLASAPQWFLTSRTVAAGVRFFAGDYQPRWKTLEFGISSLSFREKRVRLRATDFCFANPAMGAEGCLKDLDLELNARLYLIGVKITKISRLAVNGDHLTVDLAVRETAAPDKKSAALPTALPGLPAALRGFALESLSVDLPANKVTGAFGTLRGRLRLGLAAGGSRKLALQAEIDHSSGTVTKHYRGEAAVDSDLLEGGELTYLRARGDLHAEGISGKFVSRLEQEAPAVLAYSLSASARMPARRAELDFKGKKTGQDIALEGSAGVWEAAGPVKSIRLRYTLEARLKPDSNEWDTIKLGCGFGVELKPFGLARARVNLPNTIDGRLTLDARSTPGLLAGDHFNAEASVKLDPLKGWYELTGDLHAVISGRASRLRELKINHKFDFGLKVARFQDLVEFLAHTPYSVPAPVNVLRGPVSVLVKGAGDPRRDAQEIAYELTTGLAGGRQALKIKINGTLSAAGLRTPRPSFENATSVLAEEVALQLPRFDMRSMAAFSTDKRIKTGAETDKADLAREKALSQPAGGSGARVRGEIGIKTAAPILLYSNLAKDPVPLDLDLKLAIPPGPPAGTVKIRPFRVVMFRRTAAIEHITLTGRAGSDAMALEGAIVYKTAEARILIRLLGTVEKPRIELESNPPRSQDDIMAMLLFGKSPSELDSDQQSSAANARTAVANSAFGLASLYLLASTPVDYVGYDPVSKTYTVKLRLPGGATLQLGSDGESRGVQLRKRLASNLAIKTELTSTQAQGNVVTTLLEWYGRR